MNFDKLAMKAISTTTKKVAVTLAMMAIVALREHIKVSDKEKEDGSVELTVKLGMLPLKVFPTADGLMSKTKLDVQDLVPTKEEAVADAVKAIMDKAKTGAFDEELKAVQKQLAANAEKSKATREAKKAAKDADTVPEATGQLPEGL